MRDEKGRYIKGYTTRTRTSIEIKCAFCKASFFVQPHRFKNGRGRFCSVACRQVGIFTPEVRNKMSIAKLGKPVYSRRIKNKEVETHGGYKYIEWRKKVFERDLWVCVLCKEPKNKINADHIKSFSQYPELRYELSNGRTLCIDCHKKTDTYGWKGYWKKLIASRPPKKKSKA